LVSNWRIGIGALGLLKPEIGRKGQLLGHYGYASPEEYNFAMKNYAKQLTMQLVGYTLTTAMISKMISGIFPWERADKSKMLDMNTGVLDASGNEILVSPPFFKDIRDLAELLIPQMGGPRGYIINKADPTLKMLVELVTNEQLLPTGNKPFSEPGTPLGEKIGTFVAKKLVSSTPLLKLALPQEMVSRYGELYPKTKAEEVLGVAGFRTKRTPGGMDIGPGSIPARAYQTKQAEQFWAAKYKSLTDEMERAWVEGDRGAVMRLMRERAKNPRGFQQAMKLFMMKHTQPGKYYGQRESRLPVYVQQMYGL
jgi:hypothetical protein